MTERLRLCGQQKVNIKQLWGFLSIGDNITAVGKKLKFLLKIMEEMKLECTILDVHNDAIVLILKYLRSSDIVSFGLTCKKMTKLTENAHLWFYLLHRDFGVHRDPIFDNDTSNKEIYKQEKEFITNTLLSSCRNGNIKSLKWCLRRKADINKPTFNGWTPLLIASTNEYKEIVKLLLTNGADIEKANDYGQTALIIASQNGHKELVQLLISNGADTNKADITGWTPLMCVINAGRKEIVDLLVNKGADINEADILGHTALMHASRKGYKEIVERLLNREADINTADIDGHTALTIASRGGHEEIVQLLLSNGAIKKRYRLQD
jgi:ankyrin repeat protein